MSTTTERLRLIRDVKDFCTEELGIIPNCSFTNIVEKTFSKYNIYICPKNHIQSKRHDTGVIQYNSLAEVRSMKKVYNVLKEQEPFSNADVWTQEVLAVVERKECQEQTGYDRKVTEEEVCESSQVTQKILHMPKASLVGLMIHENIHIHLSLNDIDIEYSIEEAIADRLAYQGSRLFYKNDKSMLNHVERHNTNEQYFYDWCRNCINRLNKAYKNSLKEGRDMLSQIQEDYTNRFSGRGEINNAFFMMWLPYTRHRHSVQKIMAEDNPREHISRISQYQNIRTLKDLENIIRS